MHVRCWPAASGGCLHRAVEPTVLTSTPDMKVVHEEIFGPVLAAAPFTDLDEIAAAASDSEFGLGAGIWTRISPRRTRRPRSCAGLRGLDQLLQRVRRGAAIRPIQSSPAGPARSWTTTPRSRPSPRSCKTAAATGPGMAGPSPAVCSGMATSGRQARWPTRAEREHAEQGEQQYRRPAERLTKYVRFADPHEARTAAGYISSAANDNVWAVG